MGQLLRKAEKGGRSLIKWLQRKKLLSSKKKCPVCRHHMKMKRSDSTRDEYRWRCRRKCHGDINRSIRGGLIFEGSHLALSVWLKLMHNFTQGLRRRHVDLIEDGVCGSSTSISTVYDRLRDTCNRAVKRQERRRRMRMGGRRAFVVIDESQFSHKRKYNRGRFGRTWKRSRSWVFGMLEVAGERRRPVLKLVKRRNRRCLELIIQKYVKPGSTIISDCWRAYHNLQQRGFIHFQVNHQRYFVHPQTGAHTQHLERAWHTYKETVYRFRGNLSEHSLTRTLCFIEWNYWLAEPHRHGPMGRLIHDINRIYKV